MKKILTIFVFIISVLFVCSCGQRTAETGSISQKPPAEEISDKETEKNEISVSEFSKLVDGWYGVDTGSFCEILNIIDGNIITGMFEGELDRTGKIKRVEICGENSYKVTVHYDAGVYFEEYLPEVRTDIYISSDDNFIETITIEDNEGYSLTYYYAGEEYDDLWEIFKKYKQ